MTRRQHVELIGDREMHPHATQMGHVARKQFERTQRDMPFEVERKPLPLWWSLTWRAAVCVAVVWGFSVAMLAGGPA